MKLKNNILIFGVIIIIIVGGIIYSGRNKSLSKIGNGVKAVKIEQKGLNIIIDPRIELLSSIQLNSNYDLLTTLDFKYKNHMKEYFMKYTNAKAVKLFNSMSMGGFSYDAPPHLMLYYSNPPILEKQAELSKDLISRSGGELSVNSFIEYVKVYSKESDFENFYNDNLEYYRTIVNNVAKDINKYDIVGDLENYYGKKQNSYNIILAPIFNGGGYGPRVEGENDIYDVYCIIGAYDVKDNIPQYDSNYMLGMAWHEFGHSFVNNLTSKNINEIMKYSKLFNPIREKMVNQAYSNWEVCVNEHINRAVVARLTYLKFGEERYKQEINYNKANGFFYIDAISEKLKLFESSRNKYKSFEDFYPEIINVFKQLSESKLSSDFFKLKYTGPIDMLFTMENPIIIILPTNEKDENAEKEIAEYVKKLKRNITILKTAKMITDIDALNVDMTKYNIIAYGTIEGNLWLAKYKEDYPFVINENEVILDKSYKAEDLRFITGIPSPVNSSNGLLIYTAQKASYVSGINNIYHGGTDYLLVKGMNDIISGSYLKENVKWQVK